MGTDINGKNLGKGITQRRDDKRFVGKFVSSYDKRKIISKTFKKYKDCERWLINERYKDQNGLSGTGQAVKVSEWNQTWLELYTKHIRLITLKSYASSIKLINEEIGSKLISKIKPIDIMRMINNLKDLGYASSTIKGVKALCHNSFQKALENNLIINNPVKGIKVSFEDEKKIKALTVDQQLAFQNSMKNTHYCEMFNVILNTGIRISEATGLRWSDINFEKSEMYICRNFVTVKKEGKYQYIVSPTKTKSSRRTIPLNAIAVENLVRQKSKKLNSKSKGNIYDDLVFLSRAGTTCSYANIGNILRSKAKVLRKQGYDIERLSPHMLRHTFTTRAFEANVNIKVISQILGHSKIETTYDVYVTLLPKMALGEIDKLSIDGLEAITDGND